MKEKTRNTLVNIYIASVVVVLAVILIVCTIQFC